MSLILLNMKKEQLHRMVLSTFLLKMSLIYVALYLSNSGHYFKEKGSEYVRWLGEEEVHAGLTWKVWSLHKCSITYAHASESWDGVELKACYRRWRALLIGVLPVFLSPTDKSRLTLPLETPEEALFPLGWKEEIVNEVPFPEPQPKLVGPPEIAVVFRGYLNLAP